MGQEDQGSDNRRLRQQEDQTEPKRARARGGPPNVSSLRPPLVARQPFDVLRHLPPRHATPLSRVVPAVRPSDFGLMVPAALDAGGLSGVPRGRQLPERLGEQFLDDAPLRRRMGGVLFFC